MAAQPFTFHSRSRMQVPLHLESGRVQIIGSGPAPSKMNAEMRRLNLEACSLRSARSWMDAEMRSMEVEGHLLDLEG